MLITRSGRWPSGFNSMRVVLYETPFQWWGQNLGALNCFGVILKFDREEPKYSSEREYVKGDSNSMPLKTEKAILSLVWIISKPNQWRVVYLCPVLSGGHRRLGQRKCALWSGPVLSISVCGTATVEPGFLAAISGLTLSPHFTDYLKKNCTVFVLHERNAFFLY